MLQGNIVQAAIHFLQNILGKSITYYINKFVGERFGERDFNLILVLEFSSWNNLVKNRQENTDSWSIADREKVRSLNKNNSKIK